MGNFMSTQKIVREAAGNPEITAEINTADLYKLDFPAADCLKVFGDPG